MSGSRWGTAGASGIPTTDPLYYYGVLADGANKVISGDKTIQVVFWSDATSTSTSHKKCDTKPVAKVKVSQGRFRVSLHKDCVAAIKQAPDLWVELVVDNSSLGRSKIGAVPYAVEAGSVQQQSCPPGYTHDDKATGITLCKRGKDEMVKVGDFWIDRYEVGIVDTKSYNEGRCNGGGNLYGTGSLGYPSTFPGSGNWSTRVHACSVGGILPSRYMTWFQAQQACGLAGKTLCTNEQWQMAAAGTPDDSASCNVDTNGPEKTGGRPKCQSSWGAKDMVGNLLEITESWFATGMTWMTAYGQTATPWPSGYGDGKDSINNLNGSALSGAVVSGMPSIARRGGGWKYKSAAGVFSAHISGGPSHAYPDVGARCCRR